MGINYAQVEAMRSWLPMRDVYLEEMIGLEGRGEHPEDACRSCRKNASLTIVAAHATFECMDCDSRELQCHGCIVDDHGHLPLHRVRVSSST